MKGKNIRREFDYKNSGTIKLFLQHYKGHLGLFSLDMICAVLISAVDLVFPYMSKKSMEKYLPQGLFKTFFIVMIIIMLAYIVRSILYYIVTYWGHRMGTFVEADMRSEIFAHTEELSYSYFNKSRTGEILSRITTDLFEIAELSHHGPEDLVVSLLTIVGAFAILCTMEWHLALIVFAVIPLFLIFTILMRTKMSRASVSVKARTAKINAAIESGISGIRTTKAFANEELELRKFAKANEDFVESKRDYYKSMAVFHSGMEFAMCILPVIVISAGGYFIMKDSLSYIDLITFSLYVTTFISPVRKIVNLVEQYMAGIAGFKRFCELMREEPQIKDKEGAIELKGINGEIEIKDMSFGYEDDERIVLKNVNMVIERGTSFALVGPSGGGKTTLSNLIPRFFDVNEGAIYIDGIDIRNVTQRSLRKLIGIVQQDVFLFAGTVYENIEYGRPGASKEEIIEAAKRAEIHEEIIAMPNGYDTFVGERAVKLSGGQRQRIGIARVFLKNPPILILDEATSALDSVTEMRIQHAFDELSKGRTSLIIAHRLSTIRNADKIAVIDNDEILEMGTHKELIELGGEYAKLVEAQRIVES